MEIPSLRPEVGLELFKLVLLRESYLKRLEKKLSQLRGLIDLSVVGMIDLLRETTVQVVEMIDVWEKTQLSYPIVQPFKWNGENYLHKIMHDTDWLLDHSQLSLWLGFSLVCNPFVVPKEILSPYLILQKDALIIFGRYSEELDKRKVRRAVPKSIKSPYTTPIINDPEVFAHLSAKNKLDKKFKNVGDALDKGGVNASLIAAESTETPPNPYQCYLSFDLIQKIKKCWRKLNGGKFLVPTIETNREESASDSEFDGPVNISSYVEDFEVTRKNQEHPIFPTGPSLLEQSTFVSQDETGLIEPISHEGANISRMEENSNFTKSKELFYATLFGPSENAFRKTESLNESHRLSKFVETHLVSSVHVEHPHSLQHSQLWTPHEIHLQRKVQRRGGELFVLTAAGVKGRLKAPWRKNRFERMEYDIGHLRMLKEQLDMSIEDHHIIAIKISHTKISSKPELLKNGKKKVDKRNHLDPKLMESKLRLIQKRIQDKLDARNDVAIREKFLTEQYQYFKKVSEKGSLTDLDKQRQRHRLGEGEAREQDQLISMRVEDMMARKIQALIRRAFGRALRKAEIARRHRAAIVIQCQWRCLKVSRNARLRTQQLRLAVMVQRAFRMYKAGIFRRQLQLEALQRSSAMFIQRVYRGYRGRRRLGLKRDLIKSISAASDAVSLVNLKPGDIEELAAAIEDYTRDYSIHMPLAVLTVLRGILYLFNGDGSECVIVSTDEGYTEKKFIYASNASWQGIKLILRRKGRFLRRLRALIKNSLLPNPSRIFMTNDCEKHVHAIRDHIKLEDFQDIKRARHCLTQLYVYISNVIRAYDLQTLFPEYFEPGLPYWFRNMMKIREAYDRADMKRRIESKANARIEEVKRMHTREGKKFGHISIVINRNKKELEEARDHLHKMKSRFKICMDDLTNSEMKELTTLEAIVRAKGLAKDVAEGDLKEYLRATLIPDENYLKELQYNVDAKGITHLQAQTDLILCKERVERNNSFRDFDKIFKFKELHSICGELGKIKADLLILLEAWNNLLRDIGGYQYIKDLVGDNLNKYELIKDTTVRLLGARKDFQDKLESELKAQYSKVYYIINQSNLKFVDKKWDTPTIVEVDFEEYENRECCKRDYETEFRKRRQLENLELNSKFCWTPLVIFADIKLPREFISLISSSLNSEFNFHIQDWQKLMRESKTCIQETTVTDSPEFQNNVDTIIHTIQEQLQAMIDAKQNILLLANRGFHHAAKISFDNYVQAVINVLVPKPRVLYLSAENSFSTDLWLEQSSIQRNYLYEDEGIEIDFSQYDLMLGKIRKLGSHFYRLLKVFPNFIKSKADQSSPAMLSLLERKKEQYYGHLPTFFQGQFAMDFQSFLFSIKSGLQHARKNHIDKLNFEELQRKEAYAKKSMLGRVSSSKFPTSRPTTAINAVNISSTSSVPSRPGSAISRVYEHPQNKNLSDTIFDSLPMETYMDFILAMNLSIIWGLYNAPITKWTHDDVLLGVKSFREYLSKVTLEEVSKRFEAFTTLSPHHVDKLSNSYRNLDEVIFLQAQLKQNKGFDDVWEKCKTFDFHKNPARALMTSWLIAVMEYIIMTPAMAINEKAIQLPFDHIIKPSYDDVIAVMVSNEARNAMIGDMMHSLLSPTIVHENTTPVWKLFYDRDCISNMESQSLGTQMFKNAVATKQDQEIALKSNADDESPPSLAGSQLSKVIVYHHGDEILIELQINLTPESVASLDEKAIEVLQTVGLLPRPSKSKQSKKSKIKICESSLDDEIDKSSTEVALKIKKIPREQFDITKTSEEKLIWNQSKCFRFFGRMSNQDLILLIQPNYTEIFEGNIQKPLSQLILESELGYATKDKNLATKDEYEEAHARNHNLGEQVQSFSREEGYYKCISNWTCVDSVAGRLSVATIRARYLILSKLGNIAGHFVRLEIYEERYGEIRILMFGLSESELTGETDDLETYGQGTIMSSEKPEKIIFQFRVNRPVIFQLVNYCDEILEKDRLDQCDTLAMSYIFSDRLTIEPSFNWYQFLSFQSFLPYKLRTTKRGSDNHQLDAHGENMNFRLKLRLRGGPGRLVGRKLLNLKSLFFKTQNPVEDRKASELIDLTDKIIEDISNTNSKFLVLLSIFEVNSENNAHELRIVLYHFFDCQTVEYRISAMERVILFKDEETLFAQLLKRLRMVYCDMNSTPGHSYQRVLLRLPEMGSRKDLEAFLYVRKYEVDGNEEYEVCSSIDESEDEETLNSTVDEESMDSGSVLLKSNVGGNKGETKDSGWGWSMYFDRSPLSEVRGNLIISVVMLVAKRGFLFTVYDPRTFMEAHRFVYFHESLPFFQNKTISDLEEELGNLDESIAFDIIDELFLAVEVVDSDGEGTTVVLHREDVHDEGNIDSGIKPSEVTSDIVIAHVREVSKSRPPHPMARKKDAPVTYRITIEVFKAKDLARIGIYGVRNAFAVVKFNMREVGRTGTVKGTIHPDWVSLPQPATFDIYINKQSSLDACSIEVEVFDSDVNGKLTDFLGHVRFSGETLKSFLFEEATDPQVPHKDKFPKWYDLLPSKKLTDQENKNVGGKIELRGVKRIIGDILIQENEKKQDLFANDPDHIIRMQDEEDMKARREITDFVISSSAVSRLSSSAVSSLSRRPDFTVEKTLQAYKFFDLYLKELDLTKVRVKLSSSQGTINPSKSESNVALAKDSELFLKISINEIEIYRYVANLQRVTKKWTHLTTSYDSSNVVKEVIENYSIQSLRFHDLPPIECRIPLFLPLGLCCLSIEVYYRIPTIKENPSTCMTNTILVGKLDLRGNGLKEFVRKSVEVEMGSLKQEKAGISKVAKSFMYFFGNKLQTRKGGSTESLVASGEIKLSMSSSIGLQPVYRCFRLQVLSARGLPRADMFGKSDPYVRVFFNEKLLGQTNYVKSSLNPSFTNQNEDFFLMIPSHQRIDDCKLEVQIIDHDNMSQGDLLGAHIITGSVLFNFLHSNPTQGNNVKSSSSIGETAEYWKSIKCEYNGKAKSIFFPLMKAQVIPSDLDQVNDVKGDIELKVNMFDPFNGMEPQGGVSSTFGLLGSVTGSSVLGGVGKDSRSKESKFSVSSTSQQSNFMVPHKLGSYGIGLDSTAKRAETLPKDLNASIWEKELLEQLPHRLEREINYLSRSIFCLTIHSAKGLANADLFGKSDPFVRILWNGVEMGFTTTINDTLDPIWSEEFTLFTAPGQKIDCCVLELEVFDRDNHKEGDFLGSLVVTGPSLKELSKAGLSNKSISAGKKSAGIRSFNLQKSSSRGEKENKNVKGSLQISMKQVASDTGLGLLIDDDESEVFKDYHVEVEGGDDMMGKNSGKSIIHSSSKPENVPSAQVFAVAIEEPSSQVQKFHSSIELSLSSISFKIAEPLSSEMTSLYVHSSFEAMVWFNGAIWYRLDGKFDQITKKIVWKRWEDQGVLASTAGKSGSSKWSLGSKSQVNQDIQKLHFTASNKITMEDHFLIVSVFRHSHDSKSKDLSHLERSSQLVGGFFFVGSMMMDFMRLSNEMLASNRSSPKIWHSVALAGLSSFPSHIDIHDFRNNNISQKEIYSVTKPRPVLESIFINGKLDVAFCLKKEENLEDTIFLGFDRSERPSKSNERLIFINSNMPSDQIPWNFKYRKLEKVHHVTSNFSGTSGSSATGQGATDFGDLDIQAVDEEGEDEPDETAHQNLVIPSRSGMKFTNQEASSVDSPSKSTLLLAAATGPNALIQGRSRKGLLTTNEDNNRSSNILVHGRNNRNPNNHNFSNDEAKSKVESGETAIDSTLNPTLREGQGILKEGHLESPEDQSLDEVNRFKLELIAMNFTLTLQSKMEEENRVYWRGKVTPKHISFGSEDMKKVVFATRSSRLLRNKDIDELEVLSEVHQVKEFGDAIPDVEKQASLPVCVKEIVSCGPGLVTRTFRIEMLTNSNILLGTAEVEDAIQDFYRAVGVEAVPKVINKNSGKMLPIKEWDFTRIFEHIVEERLDINMLGNNGKRGDENNDVASLPLPTHPTDSINGMDAKSRKKAVFQANNPVLSDLSSASVITINRDSLEMVEDFIANGGRELSPVVEEDREDDYSSSKQEETIDVINPDSSSVSLDPSGDQTGKDEQSSYGEDSDDESSSGSDVLDNERLAKQSDVVRQNNHVESEILLSSSQSLVSSASSRFKLHNLRLHSHTKRLTGKQFSCVVLLSSDSERLLTDRPDYFFHTIFPDLTAFQPEHRSGLKLLFRCLDCQANKLHIISMPATILWESEWLQGDFQFPDLSSKFRRDKLGARLLSYLSLRFLPGGDYVLEIKIKKPVLKLNLQDELNKIEEYIPEEPEVVEVVDTKLAEPSQVEDDEEDEDDFLFDNIHGDGDEVAQEGEFPQ